MNSRQRWATLRPGANRLRTNVRERGQVLVIFAGSIVLFVALCAVVVDVSWYWANTLRVQRAADAAALAGAVFLPANTSTAYNAARGEAQKNGYTNGANAVVTPLQDTENDRQLNVTVSAPVGTFFMRVLGINEIQAVRRAKAEYVLPVPMGSPQNYYGVGERLVTTTRSPTAAVAGGNWTNAIRADGTDNNQYAVSSTTNGSAQQWQPLGLTTGTNAIPAGATIRSIDVRVRAKLTGSGTVPTSATCRLLVALSWNNGSSWTTGTVATGKLTTTEQSASAGTSDWGGHTWVQGDFTDANFRVRLTWDRGGCPSTRTVSVDTLEVVVAHESSTPDPASPGSALAPQNFWGAIFTEGGVRQNGDYYAPYTIGSTASGVFPSPATTNRDPSPTYSAGGYDYTVDFTGSASDGQVRLYDPIFCAVGPNVTSGWYGTGDHWTTQGSSGNTVVAPVAITYRLYYDINGTPYNPGDDQLQATLAFDPAGKTLGDFGGAMGSPRSVQNYGRGDAEDCAGNPAHNAWVTLASGLAGGMYRLNVETSSQDANATVGAENLFAIWVQASGGTARVYGGGRMAAYTQVGAAPQSFFLAQIEAVHKGKTLEIKLFDPGDVSGDARLYIQSPDGDAYNNVTFNYSADDACNASKSDACSGTQVPYIQTAVGGKSSFDNSMITIRVRLPDTYGEGGLTPPGVPGATAADRAGWWKIYYDVTNANDTTTWMVNILGNPVHLKVP